MILPDPSSIAPISLPQQAQERLKRQQMGLQNQQAGLELAVAPQLLQQKLQAGRIGIQDAQEKMNDERRQKAVQLYASLADVEDADKQQSLYGPLRNTLSRMAPDMEFPESYDPVAARMYSQSLIAPKDILTQQVEMEKARLQREFMTPYQEAQVEALNERNNIMREKMSAATSGKALTGPAMKDLEKKATLYEDMTRLASGFQPQFAGNTATGGLENFIGRMGGETLGLTDPGQTQWWQDYQGYVNAVRNDLFGAALTATEKAEFLKSMVTPGMEPGQIQRNLGRQQAIAQNALARGGNVYLKGGYNAEQIGEYVPEGLSRIDTASPALDGQPNGKSRIIDFNDLPD